MNSNETKKENGCVYTPPELVKEVLDAAGYVVTEDLASKTILEPSCGDGAFLVEIASRLVESIYMRTSPSDIAQIGEKIHTALSNCIMAIEIDGSALETAKYRVLNILKERYGYILDDETHIFDRWHIGDAIKYLNDTGETFDFVVGNPPYVRIHNVNDIDTLRDIPWCSKGMTDMFYAFYYIGLHHLTDSGTLAYIAPSTWMMAQSGTVMREELYRNGNIKTVIDHENDQLFDGITAYVATVVLTAKRNEYIDYDSASTAKFRIPQCDAWINGKFMPMKDNLAHEKLVEITSGIFNDDNVLVRTGFQTGNDKVFLDKYNRFPDSMKINVIKASTGDTTNKMFFPYDNDLNLIQLDKVNQTCIDEGKQPINDMKTIMLKRSGINESNWWGFARAQAISAVPVDKITIPSMFIPGKLGKIAEAPAGTGVYSRGYYVTGMTIDEVYSALSNRWFSLYAKAFGRRKRGGYLAVSGSDMQIYLRWYKCRYASTKENSD